ncbi:MAG TPA: hypothetical protein VH187_16240 [Scandinavium sp.]|uniref:hypothetical protein n=1 Tax=Scandinavium sp. TaxID=2830653 RepID=UPI002E36CBB8|nr:hypothetical protein [Scandinavium sp.]HEX4502689.1 hypothetical protein [Scandinavium sp.]
MTTMTCNDCQRCAPFDVFKGTCETTQARVLVDSEACHQFVRYDKCKFCAKYQVKPGHEFIGVCGEWDVYPDMKACERFISK